MKENKGMHVGKSKAKQRNQMLIHYYIYKYNNDIYFIEKIKSKGKMQ